MQFFHPDEGWFPPCGRSLIFWGMRLPRMASHNWNQNAEPVDRQVWANEVSLQQVAYP
jgi:hypothetical protein